MVMVAAGVGAVAVEAAVEVEARVEAVVAAGARVGRRSISRGTRPACPMRCGK